MTEFSGERWLFEAVDLLTRPVEVAGALIIFLGAMVAFVRFVVAGLGNPDPAAGGHGDPKQYEGNGAPRRQ